MLVHLLLAAALGACADSGPKSVSIPKSIVVPVAPATHAPQLQIPTLPSLPALTPLAVPAAPAQVPLTQKIAAVSDGVAQVVADLAKKGDDSAAGAGRSIDKLITGETPAPASSEEPLPAAEPDAEAVAAAQAVPQLAQAADELGAARGLKARTMSGAQFVQLVRDAASSENAKPGTTEAAKQIRAQVVRVVVALVASDKPAMESLPRLFSVWQVMGQELARHPTAAQVVTDARLFAQQVEDSVAPQITPADPDGHSSQMVPGSVFGWQPIESSPGHGVPLFDAIIRIALGERESPYAKGFELPGAPSREKAKVFFYGEKHTDGPLIEANMRRIVEDAKPGRPVIVLVEGYTGWQMEGYQAVEYLAKRGLDRDALAKKRVSEIVVRGWDTIDRYEASKHPLLQHHMDLLALNHLAFSDLRGWAYYKQVLKGAWVALKSWRALWRAALLERNPDLDAAVRLAVAEASETNATVHVIAGTDHLMQRPRLNARLPWLSGPSFRRSLRAALGGRPFWASQPPNSR